MSGKSIFDIVDMFSSGFQLDINPLNIYQNTRLDPQELLVGHIFITLIFLLVYYKKKFESPYRALKKRFMLEKDTKRKIIVYFLFTILVLIIIYLSLLASEIWQRISGNSIFVMFDLIKDLQIIRNPFEIYQDTTLNFKNLLIGHIVIASALLLLLYYSVDKKGEFHLKEKGSAAWACKIDRLKYELCEKVGNIILSATEFLPLDMRKIFRNINIIIIGGTGTRKSRSFVRPNIMQMNSSYVVTDPKGELYRDTAYMLEQNGYEVKVLNLKDPSYSDGFNSFEYIKDETDIEILAETIMENTLFKDFQHSGDPFWPNSSKALLTALLHYTNKLEEKERNLTTVFKIMLEGKMEEEGEDTDLDMRFKTLPPDHPAKNYYDIFSLAPMKTRNSILISLGTQLAFLGSHKVRNIVLKDTLDLRNHKTKRAIFVIIPESNGAYDVLASIFFTQFFQILYNEADSQEDGQLDIHHQFILDEFANIGKIPNFVKLISTMRSREISAIPILQNKAQIENLYKKNASTIIGNCDTLLYLGGNDQQAAKEMSERLGKATITVTDISKQKNEKQANSYTKNTRKDYRELMTPDEVLRLPDEELLISIRGFKPFKSKKYDLTSHENYSLLISEKTFYNEMYEENGNIADLVENTEDDNSNIEIDLQELSKKTEELLQKADQTINNQKMEGELISH